MKKLLTVHGMTSEGCRKLIINEVEKLNGVGRVSVYLPRQLVEVDYDDKAISFAEIKKKIENHGYDPM